MIPPEEEPPTEGVGSKRNRNPKKAKLDERNPKKAKLTKRNPKKANLNENTPKKANLKPKTAICKQKEVKTFSFATTPKPDLLAKWVDG